jgi:hypothetical protein
MAIRDFTSQMEEPVNRSVDDDAPAGMRQEFIDAVFLALGQAGRANEARLYQVICQSLGVAPSGNPHAGFRHAIGRDVSRADWPRVYDLICRLWVEIPTDFRGDFQTSVNRILACHRVAWDLGEDGQLHRVLPPAVQEQVETTFRELSQPRFSAALASFLQAMAAYDDRPRRERDTCSNVFDALESVAKEVFGLSTATFGDAIVRARKQQAMVPETLSVLQRLYDMANNHFRHGMTTPFTLKPAEVDFVLVSCLAAMLLFVRL